MDQTNTRATISSLSSFTPIMSILPLCIQNVWKCSSYCLVLYISRLLILECIKCQSLSGLTRQRVEERRRECHPCLCRLLCTFYPIGGAMTSCSSAQAPLVCFKLLPRFHEIQNTHTHTHTHTQTHTTKKQEKKNCLNSTECVRNKIRSSAMHVSQ